jgi:xanthine dehydrogenase accessory factor
MYEYHRLLSELLVAQTAGELVVLATVTRSQGSVPRHAGTKMLVYADGRTSGTIGGGEMESRVIQEALAALEDGQPRVVPYSLVSPERGDPGVCGGEMEIFLEPFLYPATVMVIGCGHVGRAVAHLAHWAGFRVVATDDREELVTEALIPHADVYLPGSFKEALAANPITENTFVTLVTRNVMVDRQVIPHLIQSPAPYIGVMGSERRWAETKKLLLEDGYQAADLERFHSPIGLELNAETPEEIAVSIIAEVIMKYRGATR